MNQEEIFSRLNKLMEQGHRNELRGALMMLNVVDIAEFMESLEKDKLLTLFRLLPKDISADVFTYLDSDQQEQLIGLIGDSEVRALVDDMFLDDTVDLLEELPATIVKKVLHNTDPEKRELINKFLKYPESSAGSIMTIEFAEFKNNATVQQAVDSLRETGIDKETINTCYIIDGQHHLLGSIDLRHLILARPDTLVSGIMNSNVPSVKAIEDREVVADIVRRYDLIAVPVVDKENRLVGIVTVDDVMDVIDEENTEDLEKMSGLLPSDDEYLKTSVFTLFKNRIPWLLFLMISATFTSLIISHYEDVLSETGKIGVMLTACLPMLMGTGGNCGAQSSTLVIRGLALGQITFKDIFRVLWLEIRVAVMAGLSLAVVNVGRQLLVYYFTDGITFETVQVTAVVSAAMFFTVVMAKAVGSSLPLLAKKIGLDPALMASPLITTLVDACSLTILFSIAGVIITSTV